ncbi:hypothetical protein H4J63_18110 [Pseudoalteromonas sp. 5Ae-yellow]|jgi:hypothetical protein|uniref:hypothetical protein n=1 Tax=Pseudoalteromonas sp. 5Ae-yellow TaxID=2759847 RepID=UPI0015F60771|nr:hypothetical protein [Pseudoalteromonas sp. 5Ae-yellow]MBA6411184.1 hypothetical protein [Pseudoalteromonas sp. 5Ae-yellow]
MIKGFVSIILIAVLGITLLSIGLYRFAIQPESSQTMTYGLMCIGGLLSMYGLLAMFYEGLTKKAY